MTRISPIPTTRISNLLMTQRLTQQIQNDQLALFRVQNQVSTGRRLFLPSDDPTAALRGMNLQRLLERREQLALNLDGSNSFLAAADNALSDVSTDITRVRGDALGVANTISTEGDRQAVVDTIDRVLEQLVNTSNSTFQGRFLFSGSRSLVQPYDYNGKFVEYHGNEKQLRSHVDLGLLFETNVPGSQVFGGISSTVEGTVDLNPQTTTQTLLRSINGGEGVSPDGAIQITVNAGGTPESAIIDLGGVATLGDVAELIEAGAPASGEIVVQVTGDALHVSTDSAAVLNITISEVSDGVAAKELGIITPVGTVQTTITGTDLDPVLLKTTRLDDLLGTKAIGRIVSGADNNDIVLRANQNGTGQNGVIVEFVSGGTAGSEVATLAAGTLTVVVEDGKSTAAQVATAITAEGTFAADIDLRDAVNLNSAGEGAVEVTNFGTVTFGGSGTTLDQASGLVVTNGEESATIDVSSAETVEDLLNELNGAGLSLQANINAAETGIDVRSRLSGASFSIGENGGTTATQLGIRSYTEFSRLEDFNRGIGVLTSTGADLRITAADAVSFDVDLSSALTVQDVLDALNNEPGNAGRVTAQLATVGNGIELIDNTGGPNPLTLEELGASQAGHLLGFLPEGQDTISSGTGTLQSEDRHMQEVDSVFNTLIRLRTAVIDNDPAAIGREIDRLDVDLDRALFAQAEVGAREQALDVLNVRLEDEEVQLKAVLSENIDVDLVEAITDLTARQFALQASLRTTASLLQLSVLDFI